MRARILSVVSSDKQAAADLTSIPLQTENSRKAITRHNWREVAPPIEIAESRRRFSLAQLREASAEIDALCCQVERGELDVVVTREQSRLGRYESLQHEVITHFARHGVQLHFYLEGNSTLPPEEFRKKGYDLGRRIQLAVGAVMSQDEVDRFVRRRREGMDGHAHAGRYRTPRTPWGYEREVLGEDIAGRTYYGKLVRLPGTKEHLLDAAHLYLSGAPFAEVARWHADTLGLPPPRSHSGARYLLTNPVYVGVMVYGRNRIETVTGRGDQPRRKPVRHVTMARAATLARAFIEGQDARTHAEKQAGVIVAEGQWEPVFETEEEVRLWLKVQEERARRAEYRRAYARTPRPSAARGLLRCAYCGHTMSQDAGHTSVSGERWVYLICGAARYNHAHADPEHCPRNRCRRDRMETALFKILAAYAAEPDALAAALGAVEKAPDFAARIASEQGRLAAAEQAMSRWDAAYEKGLLTLEQWEARTLAHREQADAARARIGELAAEQARYRPPERRAADVLAVLAELPALDNPDAVGARLRRIIKGVYVRDRRIVHIEFND